MKTLDEARIVFIGAGNMAEALVKGILSRGLCAVSRLAVTDVREDRREFFRRTFGIGVLASNSEAARAADVIVLAVKPQDLRAAVAEIAAARGPEALVVSIAAGIRTATIEELLAGARVVRAMPNTPALVGAGVTAVCRGARTTAEDLALAQALLGAVGPVVTVKEEDMDAVTAVSGSGPAYVFFVMEAMLAAAERLGLSADIARQLVYATVGGAARMVTETGLPPADLRERVTSKGGTTAAALEALRRREVADAFGEAIAAAHRRSQELSGG